MALITTESRYVNQEAITDPDGFLVLPEREPFRFRAADDNVYHRVGEGELLQDIAEKYYEHISDRACGLYWVLMDYQDPPIVDPTLALRPNSVIIVPGPLVVLSEILGAERTVYQ